jgi:putative PIN family toxin of toxin-antitoxin system
MIEGAAAGPDVVFDCNVYLQGSVGTSGPAAQCLRLLDADVYTLFVSQDVLEEVSDVLSRPALQHRFPELTEESAQDLLQRLHNEAIFVYNVPETFRYARDPDDEPYINLALVTNAQYLVTLDKDLLDLMLEKTEESRRFRRQHPCLTILTPADFLQALPSRVPPPASA